MYSMSLKHMAALASLSAATLLPGNLNAQPAPVPFTEQNTATPDQAGNPFHCPEGGRLADQGVSQ